MTRPKFSDANGEIALPKEAFVPPQGWKWDGDWQISPEMRYVCIRKALLLAGLCVFRKACCVLEKNVHACCCVSSDGKWYRDAIHVIGYSSIYAKFQISRMNE